MTIIARKFEARVFMEGVSVPFNAVNITETRGDNEVRADISIAPSKSVKRLKARSLVHVFFRRTSGDPDEKWYCLFEGEYSDFSLTENEGGSRSHWITAYGLGNYWNFIKIYHIDNSVPSIAGSATAQAAESIKEQAIAAEIDAHVSFVRIGAGDSAELNQSERIIHSDIHEAFEAGTLGEGIRNIFDRAFNGTGAEERYQFAIDAEERLRLVERIVTTVADTGKFISTDVLSYYVSQLAAMGSGFRDFEFLLKTVLDATFHEYTCPAAPVRFGGSGNVESDRRQAVTDLIGSGDSSAVREAANRPVPSAVPGSYIFKPNCYFVPPPGCNVFFPGSYSGRAFARSHFSEPTRLYYSMYPVSFSRNEVVDEASQTYDKTYVAPTEHFLEQSLVIGRDESGNLQMVGLEEAIKERRFFNKEYSFLTPEELEKGVVPATSSWAPASVLLESADFRGDKKGSGDKRAQNIADFKYWLAYYSVGRAQTISSEFQPWVITGFPALLIDDSVSEFHMVGYVHTVVHSFSAESSGTQVGISLCRELTEPRAQFENGSSLPPWFQEEVFSDENIGAQFFENVLGEGVRSVADFADGEGDDLIQAGAEELLERYRSAVSSGSAEAVRGLVDDVNRRPLMDLDEIFSYLGAERVTDELFISDEGKPFMAERREVVEAFVKELAAGAVAG